MRTIRLALSVLLIALVAALIFACGYLTAEWPRRVLPYGTESSQLLEVVDTQSGVRVRSLDEINWQAPPKGLLARVQLRTSTVLPDERGWTAVPEHEQVELTTRVWFDAVDRRGTPPQANDPNRDTWEAVRTAVRDYLRA